MNPILGVILKLASALLFTVMSTLIKWLGEAVPTGEVVFARSIFALIPIFAYLSWRLAGERRAAGQGAPSAADIARSFAAAVHTKRPFGHLWRGLLGGSAMALSFSAIRLLPLTDAVTISYAAPLITVLLAPFVLQERVGIYRLSAVFIGFAGVVMVLSPHLFSGEQQRGDGALLGAMLALGSAFCVSFAMLQVRKLTQTESTMSITFYFAMTCTMFGLSTAPFGWVMPPPVIAVTLVLVGILGGTAQILLTESYRHAPASLIAPFDYTSMLWALLLGFVVFGDVPQAIVFAGAAIIVASGLFVLYRERKLGLERARQRKAGGVPLS
ncbi:MAG: DMT family transporter [Rhodobiaceae bacterium]|nr:DMT family transporter [Rhodobiaceae bacterium]MCC0016820.1 DMT family transporter [Rhodobiaceae bacterium]MCC0041484.1 DMT family transporter [Rhodobiaceae bacterium]